MQVTVHLVHQVAQEMRQGTAHSAGAAELAKVTKDLGVSLQPMHPTSSDPGLASTFFVQANDTAHAKELVSRLQTCEATEAAYVKPDPAMP